MLKVALGWKRIFTIFKNSYGLYKVLKMGLKTFLDVEKVSNWSICLLVF